MTNRLNRPGTFPADPPADELYFPYFRVFPEVTCASLARYLEAAAQNASDARYILGGAVQILEASRVLDPAGISASSELRIRLEIMRRQLDVIAGTARRLASEMK
jgi:hypothetical protein